MSAPAEIVTFGCRVNLCESAVIRHYTDGVYTKSERRIIVVNTCAVTNEAERQARQTIRRLKRQDPDACIIVTGCAAQLQPDMFSSMPEVHKVLSNPEKLRAESWLKTQIQKSSNRLQNRSDPFQGDYTTFPLFHGFHNRTRAFLLVQQGCNHHCTFCIIPLTRGTSQSVAPEHIVAQASTLVSLGYKEIVLTGINLTSYGLDISYSKNRGTYSLGKLVRRLLSEVPNLERLRLSSLNPREIDELLLEIFGTDRRLMPHIHLSIQAGDDIILKRMRRHYSSSDIVKLVERLRTLRPETTLGADLIAGFPTETEAMFNNTLQLVQTCGLTHLHVFPFSPRPAAPAARMPLLTTAVIRTRASRLREEAAGILTHFLASRVGTTAQVLIESSGYGLSEDYLPVRLPVTATIGSVVQVRLIAATSTDLLGHI